jgi:PadR family transcriptional regulator PadR
MAFKGDLEALVLGVLAAGELHGYEISRRIRELSGSALKFGDAQLYPVLHQLEHAGLVGARWEPQQGKPPKKIYRLTDQGEAALATHCDAWDRFALGVANILRPVKS